MAYAAGGFYGTHVGSRMIQFGPQTGWGMVLKDALVAAGLAYGAGRVLGVQAGESVFTGGGLYTVLDGVGVATHGEYGLNGQIAAPAASSSTTKALPGAPGTAVTSSSTTAAPQPVVYPQSYVGGGYGM